VKCGDSFTNVSVSSDVAYGTGIRANTMVRLHRTKIPLKIFLIAGLLSMVDLFSWFYAKLESDF